MWLIIAAHGCGESDSQPGQPQGTTDDRDAGPEPDAQDGGPADDSQARAGTQGRAGREAPASSGGAGASAGHSGAGGAASGGGGTRAAARQSGSGGAALAGTGGASAGRAGSGGVATSASGGRLAQGNVGVPPSVPSNEPELVAFDRGTSNIPAPLLLFSGGYATFNLDLLLNPVDVASDVAAHPGAWLPWRRGGNGRVEYLTNAWKPVAYNNEYVALERGTRLSGVYEHNFESAGAASVTEERRRYRFEKDGTFAFCTVTRKTVINGQWLLDTVERKGTYEIHGYTIQLVDSDGVTSTWPFFYRPELTAIWTNERPFEIIPTPDALCVTP